MKSVKSDSAKSIQSTKYKKVSEGLSNTVIAVPEIGYSLPAACRKYNCSYTVLVRKAYQQDEAKRIKGAEMQARHKKISVIVPIASAEQIEPAITDSETSFGDDTIQITAMHDYMQNLVELIFNNIKQIPHTLMQILRLLVSSYNNLQKISFFRCTVDSFGMYELNSIISISTITDICLDRSKFLASYVSILMDNTKACLKNISLCGCEINDEICSEIATRLHYLAHSETTLLLLNLSSNHITDEGAKHLGEALRTNRHLRYLNLADNRIGDDGAISILNSLIEFVLTCDEIANKRGHHLEYLKAKRLLYLKFLSECDPKSSDEMSQFSRKTTNKKKKLSATSIKMKKETPISDKDNANLGKDIKIRAEILATEFIGPFKGPFAPNSVHNKDEFCYCLGNMVLSYLNLSYNRLMYPSVKKLLNVMQYQKASKKANQTGLLKVVIEGNNLPLSCNEYQILNDLMRLSKNVFSSGGKMLDISGRQKNRISVISQSLSSGRK